MFCSHFLQVSNLSACLWLARKFLQLQRFVSLTRENRRSKSFGYFLLVNQNFNGHGLCVDYVNMADLITFCQHALTSSVTLDAKPTVLFRLCGKTGLANSPRR